MHGDSRRACIEPARKLLNERTLVVVREKAAQVIHEPTMLRVFRLKACTARLARCRELDPVRGKSVLEQFHAHLIGARVVVEDGEQDSTHVSLQTAATQPKTQRAENYTPASAMGALHSTQIASSAFP